MKHAIDQIWRWLEQVSDPEIPVLSVVDLGVVRNVQWDDDTLHIALTPTYSGCPATQVIAQDVESALQQHGIEKLIVKTQLSPAWSSDWITERGRKHLKEYGIAPPQHSHECNSDTNTTRTLFSSGKPAQCPHCGGESVTMISQFGSTPCKAQWRCNDCLEPFDYFKCI